MARALTSFLNVAEALQANSLVPLPTGLSHEFIPSSTGGEFTGNVVISQPRTETTLIADVIRNFGPLVSLSPKGIATNIATQATKELLTAEGSGAPGTVVGRIQPMAFSDGDSGFFGNDGFFSGVGQALQGGLGQSLLNIGTQALSGFVQQQFSPAPMIQTNMAAAGPVMRSVGTAVAVGRGFFNRFPDLATGIQRLRNAGANVNRGQLWSLMKRFGPDFLISGGILTAAAVSQLAVAGPGRRRMNPGNVKALRRAHRRMKSFHNVCMTNDRMLGGRRSSKRKGSFGGSTSVVILN